MKRLKKIFTSAVMVMTVAVMSGALVAPAANAAASAGDLIKKDGLSAVYYLGEDGKRYVFPNESTFKSWYSDFSSVVTVSADELASYPLGANVVVRPGTKLVKITTDPKVYAVEPNGSLRWVQTEADAIALYGANWAQRVIDVADSFFTNYTIGQPLASNETPVGSLVKKSGETSIYYYDGTNYRLIEDEVAFLANRFQNANVLTLSNFTPSGTTITSSEAAIVKTSQGGTSTGWQPGQGTGVTVALNSMTPASAGIPAGSPVDFLKINLTASNDGAISVNSLKLTAYDLSDPTNIDEVTIYDNGVKVGTSKNINSDRVATFNFSTPLNIAAGTTKTLTVRALIAAGQTGSYALGVEAASDINAAGSTVSGSFPIVGNSMSITSNTTIGTVTLAGVNATASSPAFGEDDVVLAGFDLTAANEDVLVESLRLYNAGTNSNDIVANLALYINGDLITEGTYADRYATFALNNYEIEKGDTISVEVKGDMGITSVGDNVNLYIKDRNDFVFVGQAYGFGVQLTAASYALLDTAAEGIKATLTAGDFTIDMDKSTASGTPAKDVKPGDNDVVLATLVMKSNGENATVLHMKDSGVDDFIIQGATLTAGEIENIEMYDVTTGGIYDITATASTTASTTIWNLSMTDEIFLEKGVSKKFLIRADMSDTIGSEIDNGDTMKVVLKSSAMSIEGDTSGATINNVTPNSVTGAIITVKEASLEVEPMALTTTNAVGGSNEVVIYKAMVKAGTADGAKLQSVKLTTTADAADTFTDNNISKLDLYLNGKLLKSVANDIVEAVGAGDTITFSSLNDSYSTISAGANVALEVRASFASTLSPVGAFALQVAAAGDVVSRSVTGNKLITTSGTITGASRTVTTVANGTLKVELSTEGANVSRDAFLLAGSETPAGRYMGELKFTTANEPIKVKKLSLVNNEDATNADIKEVKLVKADGTVVATKMVAANGDADFDPFDVVFKADKSTSLFIVAVAKGMNIENDPTATATQGRKLQYNINPAVGSITASGVNSGVDLTLAVDADGTLVAGEWSRAAEGTSRTNVVTGSKLNSITNAMSDATLTGGTGKVLAKYTFVFDNGDNRNSANEELKAILDKLVVTFSKSAAIEVANIKAHIDGTATKVTADAETVDAAATSGTATWNALTLQGLSDSGKVDGAVTLVITGDVTTTADEYLQSSIADLNGAGGDDFNFIGDEVGGTALTNMYLPVAEVIGGTLSN